MAKSLKILSAVLIIWFLLLDPELLLGVTGLDEYYQEMVEKTEASHLNYPGDITVTTDVPEETTDVYEETSEMDSTVAVDTEADNADDVVELNVGGRRITTLRSTLTAVPNSKLALMFTKGAREERTVPLDSQGAVVFDYRHEHFSHLLDQLRMIKRMPWKPAYEINITAPVDTSPSNFSYMIADLGLNPDRFLYPLAGAHLNVNISSFVGWRECHRSRYDQPFNISVYIYVCTSKRLLVGCRPVGSRETLTLAGIGERSDMFESCTGGLTCNADLKEGIGFYYASDRALGFQGRPPEFVANQHIQYHNHGNSKSWVNLNPCDASDHHSAYRLCWSIRSDTNRGGGDRCGSVKNLNYGTGWERVIYAAV